MQLVLSLFPGADLFGKAFEDEGFCVVRGPDVLWGGDIRTFHVPPGRFDGIIGGPPCQVFSKAHNNGKATHQNLIPEFMRIVAEAKPTWAVMENVTNATGCDWTRVVLRDYDCGGLTYRRRGFWFYGIPVAPIPPHREGEPLYSVLASSWKNRNGTFMSTTKDRIPPPEAAYRQGFPGLDTRIMDAQPAGVSQTARKVLATHMLGNGVPLAMGQWVAQHVKRCVNGEYDVTLGLPLFEVEHG